METRIGRWQTERDDRNGVPRLVNVVEDLKIEIRYIRQDKERKDRVIRVWRFIEKKSKTLKTAVHLPINRKGKERT